MLAPAVLATLLAAPGTLRAQCPDGTPPPCGPTAPRPVPVAAPPLSVAVLPFQSRSPDTADSYLAEGTTEEVTNQLTRLGRLQVKARGLVAAQWRRTPDPFEAARRLNVAWFVHGNVRRVAGQLLVNVELVRAPTGEEAWAARFPRRDSNVFAVQAEVAESVAVQVGGRLTPRERAAIARRPTRDNEAYRLYLYGNSLFARRTEREAAQAVDAYARAVVRDPSFAAAWARLSITRGVQAWWGWEGGMTPDSLNAVARAGARRAVALDSASADAWLALASAAARDGDLLTAHDGFERAMRLDSLNPEGIHIYAVTVYGADCPLACLNIESAAVPMFRRALALDPTLRNTWQKLARVERDAGRLAEAEAHLDTALAFGPWAPASADRAYLRYLRGNATGAMEDFTAGAGTPQTVTDLPVLVRLLAGDSAPARRRFDQLRADPAAGAADLAAAAVLATALGLLDEALGLLEQVRAAPHPRNSTRCTATATCSSSLFTWLTLHDPVFRPLRGTPRFRRLWDDTRPRAPWLEETGGGSP